MGQVNLKFLVRQACEATLLSEIELVLFKKVAKNHFQQH